MNPARPNPAAAGLRNRTRGFTLVELLVAMALMTIISTILATFLMNAQRMYDVSVAQSNVISNARVALDILGRDLENITPLDAQIPTAFQNRGTLNNRVFMGESETNPRQRPVALTLRSLGYETNVNNWGTANESNQRYVPWSGGNPNQADIDRLCFLSFYATTTTVVTDAGGGPDRVARRPVFIQYYLLERPRTADGLVRAGAFLVRRVHAYNWVFTAGRWTCEWETFVQPVDEDICSYVRGVVVRYKDRLINPVAGNDLTMVEASSTPRVGPAPPSAGFRPVWEPGLNAVRFVLDPNWWEFNLSQPFVQKDFLPPSIEVSLLMNDDKGFTTREIKRLFNFPTTPVVIPPKPR